MNKNKELRINLKLLKHFEGCSSTEYSDSVGIPTIGIGRNLEVYPFTEEEISQLDSDGEYPEELAVQWAAEKLAEVRKSIVIHLPWVVEAPDEIRIILTDMGFNLGVSGLMKFKNMLSAMKDGQYNSAARHLQDSKYFYDVNNRATYHFLNLQRLAINEHPLYKLMGASADE